LEAAERRDGSVVCFRVWNFDRVTSNLVSFRSACGVQRRRNDGIKMVEGGQRKIGKGKVGRTISLTVNTLEADTLLGRRLLG
jgi:hypothetical protein